MTLEARITTVFADWRDAGDDVPEELKIIREMEDRNAKLRTALKHLLHETAEAIYSGENHDVSAMGAYAQARKTLKETGYDQ